MNYIIKIIKTDYDKVEEIVYDDEIDDEDEAFKDKCEDEVVAQLLEDAVKAFSN